MKKQITVEEIITGYKKSEIKPLQRGFKHIDNSGNRCGCALTALSVLLGLPYDNSTVCVMDFLTFSGYDRDYLWAVAYGFDGANAFTDNPGYEVGIKAWEAIQNGQIQNT